MYLICRFFPPLIRGYIFRESAKNVVCALCACVFSQTKNICSGKEGGRLALCDGHGVRFCSVHLCVGPRKVHFVYI